MSFTVDLPGSDLTLKSSDGILFKVHRINLEMHSQVFADAGGSTIPSTDEWVPLAEPAAVLEVMIKYMYLQRQPDLAVLPFEVLAGVAEAVEKYGVYAALGVCSQRMRYVFYLSLKPTLISRRECISDYPVQVLLYAARHGYADIVDECGRATIHMSVLRMQEALPENLFAAWVGR